MVYNKSYRDGNFILTGVHLRLSEVEYFWLSVWEWVSEVIWDWMFEDERLKLSAWSYEWSFESIECISRICANVVHVRVQCVH